MQSNRFLERLRAQHPQIGLWVSLADPMAAEIVAGAGFDWVMLDMEHTPNDLATIQAQLQIFAAYPTTSMVRPPWNDAVLVKRLLDLGAPGLLFPMIEDVREAERAVAATQYAPKGHRGVMGITRATQFGRRTDYFDTVDAQTARLLQIESVAALQAADAIAQVDGVDGLFFGPTDIAADMGLLPDASHPDVWSAIREAAQRVLAKGVPVGAFVTDVDLAKTLLADGFGFVACGTDAGLLRKSTDDLLEALSP